MARETTRISLFVIVLSCTLANLGQAAVGPVLQLLVPKFMGSVDLVRILGFDIVLFSAAFVPSLTLDSLIVNRQWVHLSVFAAALGLNAIANVSVLLMGWGMVAVAWNDVWIQLLVVVILYRIAQRYLFAQRGEAFRFYALAATAGMCSALLFVSLGSGVSSQGPMGFSALIAVLAGRIALVAMVWAVVGVLVFRLQRRWWQPVA